MAENFKTDFFTDRIGRGIQDIFQAQLDIATNGFTRKAVNVRRYREPGRSYKGGPVH